MLEKFAAEYNVDYININTDLTTGVSRLMNYLQETSLLHSKNAGYPMDWFSDNEKAFLLSKWHVEIEKYPDWGDRIKVETWPTSFKGIIGERAFCMEDKAKSPILKAHSQWFYTDIEKGRPIKIPENMATNFGNQFPPCINYDFSMPDIKNADKLRSGEFTVMRGDLDSNRHVNNIRYIIWAIDYVPEDIYINYKIKTLKAVYKKECPENSKVLVETFQYKENPKEITSVIRSAHNPETVHAIIYTAWN